MLSGKIYLEGVVITDSSGFDYSIALIHFLFSPGKCGWLNYINICRNLSIDDPDVGVNYERQNDYESLS